MKRITIIIATVVVLCVLSVSCNSYVCPAYTQDTVDIEHNDDLDS